MTPYQPLFSGFPDSAPHQFQPGNPGGPGRGKTRDRDSEILDRWNAPGPCGFWNWVADVQPHVLQRNNLYSRWTPTTEQREAVNEILEVDGNGRFKHSLSLLLEPRRHGKSTTFALIVLWLLTSRRNFTVQLSGNSADHIRRTQFRALKRIIQNTPRLARLITPENIYVNEIHFPSLQSAVQFSEGLSLSSAFGDRLNLLWVSDFHACPDTSVFSSLQAALLDSQDSLILIDSNVDVDGGAVHSLQKEVESDPSIFCRHVCYRDWSEFERLAPAWIDRNRAKRLMKTALEPDWKRDLLGLRSQARNSLFTLADIQAAKEPYKTPVADLKELANGRAYRVGAGLDRAKNLSPVLGGDSSVLVTVAKIASLETGEPIYYVLDMTIFALNTGRAIKRAISETHERYKLTNIICENYEIVDILPFLDNQGIPCEVLTASERVQNASFPELARIFREGRIKFSHELKVLENELKNFTFTSGRAGRYSFGAASSKLHDDCVYALNWAVYSLREQILHAYVLGSFQCKNKSPRRGLCYLMGGSKQLLCADYCHAHKQVVGMFQEFKKIRLDDDLNLQEFFESKVRFDGARIYQAA